MELHLVDPATYSTDLKNYSKKIKIFSHNIHVHQLYMIVHVLKQTCLYIYNPKLQNQII